MENKIYIGDIGTIIRIDMGEDISTASGLKLKVQKPNGTEVVWVPIIDASNYLSYTTVDKDIDQIGVFKITPQMVLGEWSGSGDTVSFIVYGLYQ
jgi:hypothetical protein